MRREVTKIRSFEAEQAQARKTTIFSEVSMTVNHDVTGSCCAATRRRESLPSLALARLRQLSLWAPPLVKTILNYFHFANPVGGANKKQTPDGGLLFVISAHLRTFEKSLLF